MEKLILNPNNCNAKTMNNRWKTHKILLKWRKKYKKKQNIFQNEKLPKKNRIKCYETRNVCQMASPNRREIQ